MTLRAIGLALLLLAAPVATATAAPHLNASGERMELTFDAGDSWQGSTDTTTSAWTVQTSVGTPPELSSGSPCSPIDNGWSCPGDRYGSLLVRAASGADSIVASGPQTVLAGAGNDLLSAGPDTSVYGEGGDDTLGAAPALTGSFAARLFGGPGNDHIVDSSVRLSEVQMTGGAGNDLIQDTGGADVIDAGSGDDVVDTRDGRPDRVDCGDGNDTAQLDTLDEAVNCEATQRASTGARLFRARATLSGARFSFTCPRRAETCDARARVTDGSGRKVGLLDILLPAGTSTPIDAELRARLRKRLRARKSIRLRVTTTTLDQVRGKSERTTRRLVLRRHRTLTFP